MGVAHQPAARPLPRPLAISRSYERAATGDRDIRGKAEAVVDGLSICQQANGGEWLGSIPERYLDRIAAGKQV